jgi:hypothetical protein
MGVARSLWEGWKRVARKIGEVQAVIVFTVLYYCVIGPVGLVLQLLSDPLRLRARGGTHWVPRPGMHATLDRARRQ